MVVILHRIGTTAPREKVYAALTTVDGLAGWWTNETTGDGESAIEFRFGELGGFDAKVLELRPDERVRWEIVGGPEEWLGTTITFDIGTDGEWTIVRFAHSGWREPVEFMAQVGDLPDEPEGAGGDRHRRTAPPRRADQQLALTTAFSDTLPGYMSLTRARCRKGRCHGVGRT